ncbi:Pentapeptide repeats (8 copies) [Clostridium sp. C105KSO15]|nr:Pentapeptide repeats (8 copies) [Clostridium sp. C105KSO15]
MILYQLHQMLWYLVEAFTLTSNELLRSTIDSLISEHEQMLQQPMDHIAMLDLSGYRSNVNNVLKQISTDISANETSSQFHGLNYLGKNFKKANLDRRNFSMSLMIAANLSGCSLKNTNFLGADLRDTNLRNADLSKSIFLTQMQINSAIGNSNTKIPIYLTRPATWEK